MAARLSILLSADAKQAKAEMAAVGTALKGVGSDADILTAKGGEAAKSTAALGTAAATATSKVITLSQAEAVAAANAGKLAAANTLSAASVGNLTAQFNDIGVMLAAGQNPLQLALQQGTQITQVIGPLGAAGAVKALGGAVLGMINPVSLFTIGAIAAGAATFQWLTSGEKARTFEEDIQSLEDAMSRYGAAADIATASTEELEERFGSAASGIRQTVSMLEQIARSEAQRSIDAIANSLSELMGISGDGDRRFGVADFFDVNIGLAFTDTQRAARAEARLLTAEFVNQQAALRNAAGDLDAQISIMQQLIATTQALAEQKDGVSEAEQGILKQLGETLLAMQQQRGKVEEVEAATFSLADAITAANTGFENGRSIVARLLGDVEDLGEAAWNYVRALGEGATRGGRGSDPRQFDGRTEFRDQLSRAAPRNRSTSPRATAGGGRATQTDEVQRHIASLRDELAVLRETDPVQKELLRNRETLEQATAAERAQIEQLTAQRVSEAEAIDAQAARWQGLESIAGNALDGLINRGDSLKDVMKNVAVSILDAANNALLFGSGPFGGGGGGLFGEIFGGLFPVQAKAAGGMIYGPGGGTEDRVPVMASNGEFMVNAAATARNRPLLEMINAGAAIPGFAAGGAIGSSRAVSGGSANASRAPLRVTVDLSGARGDREIEAAANAGMRRALEEYDREVLPQRVGQIREEPRMVG